MDTRPYSGRGIVAAVLFALIMLLRLPVFLLGYLIWVGSFLAGRRSSASRTARRVLEYLELPAPAGLPPGPRRLQRQADQHSAEWVERYRREKQAGWEWPAW